ncbi:MAG: hypothetical protein PHY16_15955 [Methylobacter sp.]|nr:hypothetical protein [Methylobacter sp.]
METKKHIVILITLLLLTVSACASSIKVFKNVYSSILVAVVILGIRGVRFKYWLCRLGLLTQHLLDFILSSTNYKGGKTERYANDLETMSF